MTTYLKPLLAIAAVVVIAIAGIAFLGRPSGSNVGSPHSPAASPSPTPSPTRSASSSPAAVFPSWFAGRGGAGVLPAGSAATKLFSPGFTFNVPQGWVNDNDSADTYGLWPNTPANKAEYALSKGLAQGVFMAQVDTPWLICEAAGGPERGATAAELVDSLAANKAFKTSKPVDVTIGGLRGRRVDFQLDPAWTGKCAPGPDDPPTKDFKDYRGRGIFLDAAAGGHLLIVIDSLHSADFEAFLAQAMPVVESFQFETGA